MLVVDNHGGQVEERPGSMGDRARELRARPHRVIAMDVPCTKGEVLSAQRHLGARG